MGGEGSGHAGLRETPGEERQSCKGTVCPRSLDPFYIPSKLLYKRGQDFLDI